MVEQQQPPSVATSSPVLDGALQRAMQDLQASETERKALASRVAEAERELSRLRSEKGRVAPALHSTLHLCCAATAACTR